MDNTIHIVYCGDKNYIPMLGISMTSVVLSNIGHPVVFHLLVDNAYQRDVERLRNFARLYRDVAGVQLHRITDDRPELQVFRSLKASYPVAVNYRLLLPRLLGEDVSRVLYLDGDVICRGSLQALWQMDLKGCLAAGAIDPLEPMHKKRTGLAHYVNSGVLLMDLAAWRREHVLDKLLDFYRGQQALAFPDQDAINTVCNGRIALFDESYNYPLSCNFILPGKTTAIPPESVLCHFVGPITKPWYITCLDPRARLWTYFRDKSLWDDLPLAGSAEHAAEMKRIRGMLVRHEDEPALACYQKLLSALGARYSPVLIRSK